MPFLVVWLEGLLVTGTRLSWNSVRLSVDPQGLIALLVR